MDGQVCEIRLWHTLESFEYQTDNRQCHNQPVSLKHVFDTRIDCSLRIGLQWTDFTFTFAFIFTVILFTKLNSCNRIFLLNYIEHIMCLLSIVILNMLHHMSSWLNILHVHLVLYLFIWRMTLYASAFVMIPLCLYIHMSVLSIYMCVCLQINMFTLNTCSILCCNNTTIVSIYFKIQQTV